MEKLTLRELNLFLSDGEKGLTKLNKFIEFDRDSKKPLLVFKDGVLSDDVPESYDIDSKVFEAILLHEKEEKEDRPSLIGSDYINIVTEGDSWFRLPYLLPKYPRSIAQVLALKDDLDINNIAYWGHTLERMFHQKEYLETLTDETDIFMLSAGGNDLQVNIEEIIHDYDESRPYNSYITKIGFEFLNYIENTYVKMFDEVSLSFPNIKIISHGYDFPRPTKDSRYIGQYMHAKGIPEKLMLNITQEMMKTFNESIKNATNQFAGAIYIDCLSITKGHNWIDDMHPGRQGYKALAEEFYKTITD